MKFIKYLTLCLALLGINKLQAQTSTTGTAVNNVVKAYLAIKNALADDNSKAANLKAKEFTAALKQVSTNQLDAKQKSTWLAYGEKLRFDGDHIAESDKIEHQREHFGSLSKNMIAVVKAFKNNDAVLYQQYCPMVKKYWLSESAAVKNPFYGKEMLDCGKTTETIKVAATK